MAKLKKRILFGFIAVILLLVVVCATGLYMTYRLLATPLHTAEAPVLFEVKPGMHAKAVLQQLHEQGLWSHPSHFSYLASRLWAQPQNLQAGVYQLQPGQTLAQFWQQVGKGEQYQFTITLVEGQTLTQWLDLLRRHAYLKTSIDTQDELQRALVGELIWPSLEGLLAPDTYHFYAATPVVDIVRKAYLIQQQRLRDVWASRAADLPYTEPYELLIMASIIEKETGLSGERDVVSSVFVNRLRKGMRLQSDPTTIYGIANFDGNLTRAHLRERTPYNTYRIDGLPPTPIAMPSLASLQAAAHPASTDYYYFVADGSGGHVFSRTLEEHNKAVNRYQRGIQ